MTEWYHVWWQKKKGHTKAVMIDGKITARLTDLDQIQKAKGTYCGSVFVSDVGLNWEYVQHVTDIACRLAVVPTSILKHGWQEWLWCIGKTKTSKFNKEIYTTESCCRIAYIKKLATLKAWNFWAYTLPVERFTGGWLWMILTLLLTIPGWDLLRTTFSLRWETRNVDDERTKKRKKSHYYSPNKQRKSGRKTYVT